MVVLLRGAQVNPHTHQLKLCDFGSAKVLVRICPASVCGGGWEWEWGGRAGGEWWAWL